MRRMFAIALLALGTVAGYGAGFAHLRQVAQHHRCACAHHADAQPLPQQ